MNRNQFSGFPKEGIAFLRSLAKNNDREWFQPRKAIYEEKVRQPMIELTGAVHREMMRFAPAYVGDPAKSIFRVYRDTRFSKDKTPYKTHIAASLKHVSLSKDSGQFGALAGYYFSISPKEIGIGGGLYMPPPPVLLAARHHIADHHKEFRATYSGTKVRRLLGELQGDTLTRVPKGFDADHPAADLLKKKYWMLYIELDPALATSPMLLKEISARFEAIAPLVDFLNRPLMAQGKKREREGRFSSNQMELVKDWYGRRMHAWEYQLATRSTDRVVRPFDWGIEWTREWPFTSAETDPELCLQDLNRQAIAHSAGFFAYEKPRDFRLVDGECVRFTSAVKTPYAENNTVEARYFPAHPQFKRGNKAVVLLPHWNSSAHQHVTLCQGIARLGISVVRLSLPYHDRRMPAELTRADYAVSANVARTVDATRQAVIDVRACLDWLEQRGYQDLGIVGTSLGSCYAFLASAHDERIRVNVFNHCSTLFADIVWQGISSRHIRQGFEGQITLDRLRAVWDCLSPVHYMDRYAAMTKKSFFLYAIYDTTFPPEFSRQVVTDVKRRNLHHKIIVMPCGHYTLGEAPFKFVAGYQICAFLKRNL